MKGTLDKMNEEEKKAIEYWKNYMNILHWNTQWASEYYMKILLKLIKKQQNRIQELEKINTEHQKLNGELRQEIKQLKHKIQKIMDYVDNL